MKIKLAGCVIKNSEGEILLIHRNTPKRKQWEIPGGKIEENENPIDTAVRELKEELGVDVVIIDKLGQEEFGEEEFRIDYAWYAAEIKFGTPKIMEKGFDDIKYFSKKELEEMSDQLSQNVKNLLKILKF